MTAAWEDRVAKLAEALAVVEKQRAHIEALFDGVPVCLVELGLDGGYLSMNDRHREFVRALGYRSAYQGQAAQVGKLYAADNRRLLEHSEMPSVRVTSGESFTDYVVWIGAETPDLGAR